MSRSSLRGSIQSAAEKRSVLADMIPITAKHVLDIKMECRGMFGRSPQDPHLYCDPRHAEDNRALYWMIRLENTVR